MFFAHILLGRRGGIYPARRTRCPQPNSDSALNLAPPLSIRGPNAGRSSPLRPPLEKTINGKCNSKLPGLIQVQCCLAISSQTRCGFPGY
jgi:hypothetical protein